MTSDYTQFICEYCRMPTTINAKANVAHQTTILAKSFGPDLATFTMMILCPNPDCEKVTLRIALHKADYSSGEWQPGEQLNSWQLLPAPEGRDYPDYVPLAIREDYREACPHQRPQPKGLGHSVQTGAPRDDP
jgi:hypothetical protein